MRDLKYYKFDNLSDNSTWYYCIDKNKQCLVVKDKINNKYARTYEIESINSASINYNYLTPSTKEEFESIKMGVIRLLEWSTLGT